MRKSTKDAELLREAEGFPDGVGMALFVSFTSTGSASREELLHMHGAKTIEDLLRLGLIQFVAPMGVFQRGYRLTPHGSSLLRAMQRHTCTIHIAELERKARRRPLTENERIYLQKQQEALETLG